MKTLELLCLDKVQSPVTGSIQLLTTADAKKFGNKQKLIKYYTYDQSGELLKIVEVKIVKDIQGKIRKTNEPKQIFPGEQNSETKSISHSHKEVFIADKAINSFIDSKQHKTYMVPESRPGLSDANPISEDEKLELYLFNKAG